MGLVHLVEEHHGIGALFQLLGQLATLLVADVAWWGPNKLGHLGEGRKHVTKAFPCFEFPIWGKHKKMALHTRLRLPISTRSVRLNPGVAGILL